MSTTSLGDCIRERRLNCSATSDNPRPRWNKRSKCEYGHSRCFYAVYIYGDCDECCDYDINGSDWSTGEKINQPYDFEYENH
ncbi:MAG: hypothetical protein AMDU1_APLC00004G0036 [Thermoplasmatales archaeon A-plasma]|nr:MAG: hypothetical protein AMDU1_APLC00004G0036 [Thermoplasmatales archaeon A-plasma]